MPSAGGVSTLRGQTRPAAVREKIVALVINQDERGKILHEQGAQIVDMGAESTLAQAARADANSQKSKLLPVVKGLRAAKVLVSEFEGKKFNRPNDLVANKAGDIYFTDSAPMGVADPPLPSALYKLSAKGELTRVTKDHPGTPWAMLAARRFQ